MPAPTAPAFVSSSVLNLGTQKQYNFLSINPLLFPYIQQNTVTCLFAQSTNVGDPTKIDCQVLASVTYAPDLALLDAIVTYNAFPPLGITATPATLHFGNVADGTDSAPQQVLINAKTSSGVAQANAPVGFLVSNSLSGIYGASATLSNSFGTADLVNVPLFVKFHPLAVIAYADNVALVSTDITAVNIAVDGIGI